MKISNLFFVLGIVLTTFIACQHNENVLFDAFQATDGKWKKEDIKTFVWETKDTLQPTNIFMNLRVNENYPYSNLFVIFKIYKPNSSVVIDTIEFQMADAEGKLLGNGFSDVKESKLWLKEGFVFNESGKYKMTIEQAVRELGDVEGVPALKGVSEIGLSIEKEE